MENEKLLAKNLFDYSRTIAKPLLETVDYPWEALPENQLPKDCIAVSSFPWLRRAREYVRLLVVAF